MQISGRQQWLTIAAIAVVALFAGDKLLVSPLTSAWKKRAASLAELRKEVTQGKGMLEREQSIRRRWDQIRRNTLPNNASSAEQTFFRAIDRWAQSSGVSVTALTPQWRRDSDKFAALQCRIDASGGLGNLSHFIYDIERDPMALKLESLELGARDKDGQQLTLALQISGLVLNPEAK
jgi:Tfp pilus assembly protein PilO